MNALAARMALLKPRIKGEWMPVYFEPIFMSGERFTIAIAAKSEAGDLCVFNTLEPRLIRLMYKDRADEIIGLIDLVVDSLRNFVEKYKTLQLWHPPIEGIFTGKVAPAEGIEFKHIINQGVQSCASLSGYYPRDDQEESHEQITTAIKNNLLKLNPEYKNKINKNINLPGDVRPRHYNFMSENYASNIVVASHGSDFLNRGLVKVMDMDALKHDVSSSLDIYDIIIIKPIDKPMDEKVVKQVKSEANRYGLSHCILEEPPEAVANYIHRRVANSRYD